jgi:nitroreductase
MDVLHAVQSRRSIRRYKADPIPRESIEAILDAGRLAPSGKNNQPWRFVVVQNEERERMHACLQAGIEKAKGNGLPTGSAENTFRIMREAPVTVFIFDSKDATVQREQTVLERVFGIVNVQSVGGAIQTMLLRAQEMGIGSLWICDTFYAYDEICAWLGRDSLLVAAVALGYPDEQPAARPRLPLDELVEWRG